MKFHLNFDLKSDIYDSHQVKSIENGENIAVFQSLNQI